MLRKCNIILFLIFAVATTIKAQISADSAVSRVFTMGSIMPPERVYLQFDNSSYYLGETMWFKAFVASNNDDRATEFSRVLYVELVAPEGYVVKTEKYKIGSDGYCNGEIYLDPLYLSGYYEIRAYTRYMLNWGDEAIFSRVFPVFDKVNGNNWSFKNMLNRSRLLLKNQKGKSPFDTHENNLRFYPEGGHLVNNLETRVAYELTGEDGRSEENEIIIYGDGKELMRTTPEHQGKGSFTFIPQQNIKYTAEVEIITKEKKSKKHKFKLPIIKKEGVAISLTEKEDSVEFKIKSNATRDIELGFTIVHRSSIGFYKKLSGREQIFCIAKEDIPEGVSRAVVFCGETPLAERMFFVEHNNLQKGDRETVRLNIKADGKELHRLKAEPHKKITLTIEREDGLPIADTTHLALSITDNAGTTATSWGYNMYSYLLLGSEVRGYIPNAEQYFDPDNKKRKEHLDLVMLTNGWTAYDWEKLTANNTEGTVAPEKEITLRGKYYMRTAKKILNEIQGYTIIEQPQRLVRMDVAYDDSIIKTATFRTDEKGAFSLALRDFYGKRVVALSPINLIKHSEYVNYTFVIDRYFSPHRRYIHWWERNIGRYLKEKTEDSLSIVGEYFLLENVDITAKKKKDRFSVPPISELRLDYLDEWEYAMDVTYFKKGTYSNFSDSLNSEFKDENYNSIFGFADSVRRFEDTDTKEKEMREHLYSLNETLSASNVVMSIFKRYQLPYSFWIHNVVVKGEYNKDSTLLIDEEYIHGIHPEKMTDFKEIIITSDPKKTQLIKGGGEANDFFKGQALKNKGKHAFLYYGFLSSQRFIPENLVGDEKFKTKFLTQLRVMDGLAWKDLKISPPHPNRLACFIPNTPADSTKGIVADLSVATSTRRYTRLQGYSKSKQFYSPDYSNTTPTQEDHRRTLLWDPAPKAKNGKIEIEFYNSTTCEAINVNIEGRGGNTFYGNNKNIKTKTHDGEERKKRTKNIKVRYAYPTMDSTLMAQCEAEFAKAEIYYSQKRYSKSLTPYIELAQLGYAPAIHRIAQCYLHGRALKRKETLAYDFMLKAAEKEHEEAQFELAMMLRDGTGTKPDTIEAIKWLEKAAERKEPNALCELGKLLLTEGDTARGAKALQEATTLKHPEAMFRYGIFLTEKGVEKDSLTGTPLHCIEEAANLKNPDALIYMMNLRDKENNITQAYKHARELQLQGVHEGIKFIADCYFAGRGVRRDKKLAKDLYRDAAKAGNKEAKKILKEW